MLKVTQFPDLDIRHEGKVDYPFYLALDLWFSGIRLCQQPKNTENRRIFRPIIYPHPRLRGGRSARAKHITASTHLIHW